MDKNKGHMDAKDFFKLLDADANQDSRDLDEFDLEALEGLKMVKDPLQAKAQADANIDKKLEEILAAEKDENSKAGLYILPTDTEKKNRPKAGLYIMSIAASLVLLIGLFFVFRSVDNKATVADTNVAKSPVANEQYAADSISTLDLTSSDERIAPDKEPLKNGYVQQDVQVLPLESPLVKAEDGKADRWESTSTTIATDSTKMYFSSVKEDKRVDFKKSEEQEIVVNAEVNDKMKNKGTAYRLEEKTKLETQTDADNKKQVMVVSTEKDQEYKPNKKREIKAKATGGDDLVVAPAMADQKLDGVKNVDDESTVVATPNASGGVTTLNATSTSVNTTSANNVTLANTTPPVSYEWTPGTGTANGATTVTNAGLMSNTGTYTVKVTDANGATASKPAAAVKSAEFVGGKTALEAYIKKNLIVPAGCSSEEVIIVKLIVDKQGLVTKAKIESKTGNCPDCEKEALRFAKAMPAWIAATQNGVPMVSQKTILLSFKK